MNGALGLIETRGLVAHAHRAAHRDDRVEVAPVRQRLALVELHTRDSWMRRVLAEDVSVDAGRLAGDVLENEDVHQPAYQSAVSVPMFTCTFLVSRYSSNDSSPRSWPVPLSL